MDHLRLKRRLQWILGVGGILAALTYLGTMATRARLNWAAYRAEAQSEEMFAEAEALNANFADGVVKQMKQQGRTAEVELWTKSLESHRGKESLHRRKSQELLSRWW